MNYLPLQTIFSFRTSKVRVALRLSSCFWSYISPSQDSRNIAHIIAITLKALEKLQQHVLDDIVGAFQISLDGYSAITFNFDDPENVDTTE